MKKKYFLVIPTLVLILITSIILISCNKNTKPDNNNTQNLKKDFVMHFHDLNDEYFQNESVKNAYGHSSLDKYITKYVWSIKRSNSDKFEIITNNSFKLNYEFSANDNKAIIKVEGYDANNKLIDSCEKQITVSLFSKNEIITSIVNAGIDEKLLHRLINYSDFKLPEKEVKESDLKQLTAEVTNLNLSGITYPFNLKGIKYFYNISELDLDNTEITNLNEVNKFKNLQFLNLANNKNILYETLNNDNITTLNLENNNLSDLSFLSKFVNLSTLFIANNNCNDSSLMALKNLPNLVGLDISNNKVTSLNMFADSNIMQVQANNTLINSLADVKEVKTLNYLMLEGNNIKNLDHLNETNIQFLDLNKTQVSSMNIPAKNTNIMTLSLNDTKLEEVKLDLFPNLNKDAHNRIFFEYKNTPAYKKELSKIPGVNSFNSANVVYYDGNNGTVKGHYIQYFDNSFNVLNNTETKYNAKTDEIIGFNKNGFYVNREVHVFKNNINFYNIYYIKGLPEGKFTFPKTYNDKLDNKSVYKEVINNKANMLKNKINSGKYDKKLITEIDDATKKIVDYDATLAELFKIEDKIK